MAYRLSSVDCSFVPILCHTVSGLPLLNKENMSRSFIHTKIHGKQKRLSLPIFTDSSSDNAISHDDWRSDVDNCDLVFVLNILFMLMLSVGRLLLDVEVLCDVCWRLQNLGLCVFYIVSRCYEVIIFVKNNVFINKIEMFWTILVIICCYLCIFPIKILQTLPNVFDFLMWFFRTVTLIKDEVYLGFSQ